MDSEAFRDLLATAVANRGIENATVRYSGSAIQVRYRTAADNQSEFGLEVGNVAVAYANVVGSSDGYRPPSLTIWITDDRGNKLGEYTVETDLALEYWQDDIDVESYLDTVFGTANPAG